MPNIETVIKGLECCRNGLCLFCPYNEHEIDAIKCKSDLNADALALLKAQEPATIEPKRIELANETKEWLDKMDAVDALGNIADICIDWDGYRTADGLGGLINEIWAYARYCADRLEKAQEPVKPIMHYVPDGKRSSAAWQCGNCLIDIGYGANYCYNCGRKVKWE